jgi:hypothetical protein
MRLETTKHSQHQPQQGKVSMAQNDKPHDTTETQIEIEAAIKQLVEEGILYDTGRRRWSERTGRYQIVYARTVRGETSH